MPHFEGEEHQNVYTKDGDPEYTEEYKHNAVEVVCMNNTHKCATEINGYKKDLHAQCIRGYSQTKTVLET